jgi:hypothetical protein
VRRIVERGDSSARSANVYREVDGGDPVAAVYGSEWRTVVQPIDLARMRLSRIGLPVDGDRNPFVRTVWQHHNGSVSTYSGSALEAYYRSWEPTTVSELLGLCPDAGPVADHPPASAAVPWMADAGVIDPAVRLAYADRWARIESARAGRELELVHGHKMFGPVSDELGELEFGRYAGLGDSIAATGFVPEMDGEYVGVQILVDGGDWAALTTGPGLHRVVAAAALGVDPLVVAIDKHPRVVARADVDRWPGVCCGLYSRRAALALFDRILAGEPPAGFPG